MIGNREACPPSARVARCAVKGIKNVSGVSCHISASIQLLFHGLPGLAARVMELSDVCAPFAPISSPPFSTERGEFVRQLGLLFKSLGKWEGESSGISEAADPLSLFDALPASLDYRNVGDSAVALRVILVTIREGMNDMRAPVRDSTFSPVYKVIDGVLATLSESLLGGTTVQRIEGSKRMLGQDGDGRETEKIVTRSKPEKECPLSVPLLLPVQGHRSLLSALASVTVEPQSIAGYDWDSIEEYIETESLVERRDESSSSSSGESTDGDGTSLSSDISTSSSSDDSSEEDEGKGFGVWRTKKYSAMKRLPSNLLLQLRRSEYRSGRIHWLSKPIAIPAEIIVAPYFGDCADSGDCEYRYMLAGAIVHVDIPLKGSDEDAGHYIAYIKADDHLPRSDGDCEGLVMENLKSQLASSCAIDDVQKRHWVEVDDETTKRVVAPVTKQSLDSDNETCVQRHVLNILSGRYVKKARHGGTKLRGSKYATVLLYSRT